MAGRGRKAPEPIVRPSGETFDYRAGKILDYFGSSNTKASLSTIASATGLEEKLVKETMRWMPEIRTEFKFDQEKLYYRR